MHTITATRSGENSPETDKKLMKTLLSPWVSLAGIIIALLATIRHSVLFYAEITGNPGSTQTLIYASIIMVAIDLSVLIFAINGNERASSTFAFLIFFTNLAYFWMPLDWPGWKWDDQYWLWAGGMAYAGAFAYAVYFYTEIFTSHLKRLQKATSAKERQRDERQKLEEARKLAEKNREEAEKAMKIAENFQEEAENLRKKFEEIFSALPEAGKSPEKILAMAEKYEVALETIGKNLEVSGKTPENLRKKAAYWKKKSQQEELSPEERNAALLKADVFELAHRNT
ncbi:MAG: hypothetical protein AAFR61_15190 [Bacteroidota bacterium]